MSSPFAQVDESDPLLDDPQIQYGGIGPGDVAQPDEEELRREREELEHITTEATDNMIDVSHSGDAHLARRFAHHPRRPMGAGPETSDADSLAGVGDEEDEERAWLESIQGSSAQDAVGIEAGALCLDVSQLKPDAPTPLPKRSLKGKLPG